MSKCVKVCQSMLKYVKVCQSMSKCVEVCQNVSMCVEVCQSTAYLKRQSLKEQSFRHWRWHHRCGPLCQERQLAGCRGLPRLARPSWGGDVNLNAQKGRLDAFLAGFVPSGRFGRLAFGRPPPAQVAMPVQTRAMTACLKPEGKCSNPRMSSEGMGVRRDFTVRSNRLNVANPASIDPRPDRDANTNEGQAGSPWSELLRP